MTSSVDSGARSRAGAGAGRLTGWRAVFRREFRSYFSSPLGYVFIVVFLVGSGYLMVSRDYGRFLELREANLDPLFGYLPWIFVVIVPAVAMRLWAEERKSGTVELLLTLPIGLEGAYLGKFLAGWAFLAVAIAGTWPAVLQVVRLGDPDPGPIVAGYAGALLAAGAFLAVGMFFSALAQNQVVAFILAVAASVLFLLFGLPQTEQFFGRWLGGYAEQLVASVSLLDHYHVLTRGIAGLGSVLFFVLFTLAWLIGGMIVLHDTKAS